MCAFPAASLAAHGASLSQRRARLTYRAQARRFIAIANALPKIRALRAEYPRLFETQTELPSGKLEVLYFTPSNLPPKIIGNVISESGPPPKEIGRVIMDGHSGRVLEQLTGIQLTWELAAKPSLYGRHVSALYIWLPLCLLFILPFFNFRRPFSLLHLDLLVLLSFSVSLAFFEHSHVRASVPLVYPPLIYVLARMLALLRRGSLRGEVRPLHLLVPASWLAVGVVVLIGFRIALNITDSSVIDVSVGSALGAHRIAQAEPLYGSYPAYHEHQDTYGPVIYESYLPFEWVFGYQATTGKATIGATPAARRSTTGALPAAHAAAIFFDLLAVAVVFLLGRRVRGPTLGIALAYAWVSYPFTLFTLENNSNDTLIAVLVLAALLAATYRSKVGGVLRGVFAALAGLTKFVPLALAPLLATHGLRELSPKRRPRALALFLAGFAGTGALVLIPGLTHDSLQTIYERTIEFQANRETPFSVWGLYGALGGVQIAVQIAAVVLALTLAVVPRRPDLVGLAAACAAVIVAIQLGLNYWFYLYLPWFFPLAMVALLGRFSAPGGPQAAEASTPARSSQPAAAA
jgi:hypothetical protein